MFSLHAAQRSHGMASKGLRAAFISTVTEDKADYRASQTTETLISYDRVLGCVIFCSLFNALIKNIIVTVIKIIIENNVPPMFPNIF